MYSIQANASGSRNIQVSDRHLQTIKDYSLFQFLTDSHGIVDESVLDKLKLHIRSIIAAEEGDSQNLLDLCIDVIYHKDMKAFGLKNLITLYNEWVEKNKTEGETTPTEE